MNYSIYLRWNSFSYTRWWLSRRSSRSEAKCRQKTHSAQTQIVEQLESNFGSATDFDFTANSKLERNSKFVSTARHKHWNSIFKYFEHSNRLYLSLRFIFRTRRGFTFNHLYFVWIDQNTKREHIISTMNWKMNVSAEAVQKIVGQRMDYCQICSLPILIYGRMIPCKQVMCIQCANSNDLKTCLKSVLFIIVKISKISFNFFNSKRILSWKHRENRNSSQRKHIRL